MNKKMMIAGALAAGIILASAVPTFAQGYYGGYGSFYSPNLYGNPNVYQTYYTPAPSAWPGSSYTSPSYNNYGTYSQPSYNNYNYGYNSYQPNNSYGRYGSFTPVYGTNSGIYNGQPLGGGFYPNSSCYGGFCF